MSGECDIVTSADGMRLAPQEWCRQITGMLAFQLTIDGVTPASKRCAEIDRKLGVNLRLGEDGRDRRLERARG
jgi:hypothetical protein